MSVFIGGISGVDKVAVSEVIGFAENNYRLHKILMEVYLPNLQKKKKAGKYDREKAVKLLEYYYQNYIRAEMKKPSEYGWDPKLNPEERKMVARYFRDYLEEEHI